MHHTAMAHVLTCKVAPFTGAWIEISYIHPYHAAATRSHPSRVRGLKCLEAISVHDQAIGRTLHGCVD